VGSDKRAPRILTSELNPNNLSEVRRKRVVYSWFSPIFAAAAAASMSTAVSAPARAAPKPACEPIADDYYEALFAAAAHPEVAMKPAPDSQNETPSLCTDPAQAVCEQAGDLSGTAGAASKLVADDPALVPDACVRGIMERRPQASATYLYAKCDSETDAAKSESIRCVPAPRLTDAYVAFTRRAFIGAFECLGEDPREFVGLIGLEAAFQSNLGNTSHAWGVGQITPQAGAPERYGKQFEPYRDKPECAPYKEAMSLDGIKKSTPCLLTTPPMGPVRNFLFAGLLFKTMHSEAEAIVPKSQSAAVHKRIVRELTMEMYNAGDGGVSSCWHSYLADHPDGASSYEKFSSASTGFPAYLAQNYGTTIKYYESNTDARDQVRVAVSHYVAAAGSTAAFANRKSKGCAK
jgi:hypothetical protein